MRRRLPTGWLREAQERRAKQVAAVAPGSNRQRWFCERCDVGGVVPYDDHEGVYGVLMRIEDAHKDASPACATDWGRTFIRVNAGRLS